MAKLKPLTKAEIRTYESLRKRHMAEDKSPDCSPHIAFAATPAEPVQATGIQATLAERGARYGAFSDHARLAQSLQDVMRDFGKEVPNWSNSGTNWITPWNRLTAVQKQALTVIADKIARILSGDPNYADNWHDIQGYAKLGEASLESV